MDWIKEGIAQVSSSSATEAREIGNKIVVAGIAAIVLILAIAAVLLFINLQKQIF